MSKKIDVDKKNGEQASNLHLHIKCCFFHLNYTSILYSTQIGELPN